MLEDLDQLDVESLDDGDGFGEVLFGQLCQSLGFGVLLLGQQAAQLELVSYLQKVLSSLVLTRHINQSTGTHSSLAIIITWHHSSLYQSRIQYLMLYFSITAHPIHVAIDIAALLR
jgi:hypothetical protein